MLVNDYISYIKTADRRHSKLSYMAEARNTVKTLIHLDLINGNAKTITKNNI